MAVDVWEGIAQAIQDETGLDDPPVSAFELASVCGLSVAPWSRGDGALIGELIRYPVDARETRQHGLIAHEVAHWALVEYGEQDSEEGARWLSGALMLPRRRMDGHLRESWCLERLRELHRYTSAEMIARRIPQVRSANVTIYDQGKLKTRLCSPWLTPTKPTRREREAAESAMEHDSGVVRDGDIAAYPIIDPPWHRVIVIRAL